MRMLKRGGIASRVAAFGEAVMAPMPGCGDDASSPSQILAMSLCDRQPARWTTCRLAWLCQFSRPHQASGDKFACEGLVIRAQINVAAPRCANAVGERRPPLRGDSGDGCADLRSRFTRRPALFRCWLSRVGVWLDEAWLEFRRQFRRGHADEQSAVHSRGEQAEMLI
jgi:hypothetical protein